MLRDTFIKQARLQQRGLKEYNKRKWTYYDQMSFLLPHSRYRDGSSVIDPLDGTMFGDIVDASPITIQKDTSNITVEDNNEEILEEVNNYRIENQMENVTLKREYNGGTLEDEEYDEDEHERPRTKYLRKYHESQRYDPDEQFLLSFLPAFKRITPKQNAQARLRFQEIIFNIEFGTSNE